MKHFAVTSCWLTGLALAAHDHRSAQGYLLDAVLILTDGARLPVVASRPLRRHRARARSSLRQAHRPHVILDERLRPEPRLEPLSRLERGAERLEIAMVERVARLNEAVEPALRGVRSARDEDLLRRNAGAQLA